MLAAAVSKVGPTQGRLVTCAGTAFAALWIAVVGGRIAVLGLQATQHRLTSATAR